MPTEALPYCSFSGCESPASIPSVTVFTLKDNNKNDDKKDHTCCISMYFVQAVTEKVREYERGDARERMKWIEKERN